MLARVNLQMRLGSGFSFRTPLAVDLEAILRNDNVDPNLTPVTPQRSGLRAIASQLAGMVRHWAIRQAWVG